MKFLVYLTLLFISLNASDIQYKGNIGLDYKKFDYSIPFVKNKEQKALMGEIELKKEYDDTILFTKIEALKDKDDKERSYIKTNELYIKYESDNYDLKVGKDIKYWGALELHNITDIYNKKNTKNNEFDKNKKLGRIGISYNYYMENEDSISLIIAKDKILDDDETDHNISSFIKYSGSRDDIASRDFTYIISSVDEKLMMYDTLIVKDTIFKLEYIYSNKIKKYQSGTGLEHTLYGITGKKDLSLMFEYYRSDDKKAKYENNIFVATRLSFNNSKDTSITLAIIKDKIKDEYSKTFELKSRIYDNYKINLSYMKNDSLTVYTINTAYYF